MITAFGATNVLAATTIIGSGGGGEKYKKIAYPRDSSTSCATSCAIFNPSVSWGFDLEGMLPMRPGLFELKKFEEITFEEKRVATDKALLRIDEKSARHKIKRKEGILSLVYFS